jgi:hypothetical protein
MSLPVGSPGSSTPLRGRSALPLGVVLLLLPGCVGVGRGLDGDAPQVPEPRPDPIVVEEVEELPAPEVGATPLLYEAERRMGAGEIERAVEAYETYLAFGGSENGAERALWGLALAYLLPDSPVRNRERATSLLERLLERHPESVEATQARWVQQVLQDLSQTRAVAEERERTIRQLNETVEQLKQIDLNRRPVSGRPPDTIPRPRPRP